MWNISKRFRARRYNLKRNNLKSTWTEIQKFTRITKEPLPHVRTWLFQLYSKWQFINNQNNCRYKSFWNLKYRHLLASDWEGTKFKKYSFKELF